MVKVFTCWRDTAHSTVINWVELQLISEVDSSLSSEFSAAHSIWWVLNGKIKAKGQRTSFWDCSRLQPDNSASLKMNLNNKKKILHIYCKNYTFPLAPFLNQHCVYEGSSCSWFAELSMSEAPATHRQWVFPGGLICFLFFFFLRSTTGAGGVQMACFTYFTCPSGNQPTGNIWICRLFYVHFYSADQLMWCPETHHRIKTTWKTTLKVSVTIKMARSDFFITGGASSEKNGASYW